ncbi:MAG: ankyrin repeat domain-containing protein, partial [Burkholderiaceae bacterium]|nr:ankyrin repeat domain-containing protein [Burkholderiaceae bacterium]
HESEQFTMPVGREFADLGPYFSRIVFDAVARAVDDTNAAIAATIDGGGAPPALDQLQSAAHIAGKVWEHIFVAIPANETLDLQLSSAWVSAQYPGLLTVYQPARSIYNDPLLVIDLTKAVRTFFRAGTVSAGGQVFGSDKLIHFINVGRIYHAKYETRRARGLPQDEAIRSAIASTGRNPLFSEDGVLGNWTTGIRSNGDLAADYAGLQFYRNLTEEVRIGPRALPPMLERDGPFWRVRVDRESDFFTVFIGPHWNEALNPSRYMRYTRGRIRALLRERCPESLAWYRDERGRPLSRTQFESIERRLATLHGDDYDHRSSRDPVSIASTCFAGGDPSVPAAAAAAAERVGVVLERSDAWWAARGGDVEALRAANLAPAARDEADVDGETLLHAAVRSGEAQAVQQLLRIGADPGRAAVYGVTPLMLASAGGKAELAELLLRAGADPNQRDLFGKTALFDALRRGHVGLTDLLLGHGADPNLVDDAGNAPLHLAARLGHAAAVRALLEHGADATRRNAAGSTAEDLALRAGRFGVAGSLRAAVHARPLPQASAAGPSTRPTERATPADEVR